MSNKLVRSQSQELYDPATLEVGQQASYNDSDLRLWENKTADTYQSLKHFLARFNYRNRLYRIFQETRYENLFKTGEDGRTSWFLGDECGETPTREVSTVLEIGVGEGRIGGMLARIKGINIMGLDISIEQLNRLQERIKEEGQGLRGEKETPGLSYHALRKLQDEGFLTHHPIISDKLTSQHFLTVQGSFFELAHVLNNTLVDWHKLYPGIDPYKFFHESIYNEYAFSDRRDMFADVGFDAATIPWHTFCEIGSPENQKLVLEQILNVLNRGGELMIEIPDRGIEPYASALRVYNAEHPDEPYGTIRDQKPEGFKGQQGENLYPPRYFPDINELILLLKSVGYEINPTFDIQSYLITKTDPVTGQESLTLKEYFITARKSK